MPTKDRIPFLDSMNYNLGLRMALIYKKMGYGYKTANYPSWLFKKNIGQHEGKDLVVNCRPDTSIRTRFLDYLQKLRCTHGVQMTWVNGSMCQTLIL
jgi:hypothetical protein